MRRPFSNKHIHVLMVSDYENATLRSDLSVYYKTKKVKNLVLSPSMR